MKILILGAGRVGASLAEQLVLERNDITLVDTSHELLAELQERFDLRTVYGSATSLAVLEEAGAADADILIAVTAEDEVNLAACLLAHRRFNVPRRIARFRSTQWVQNPDLLGPDAFAVDMAISPEQTVTDYLIKLIETPEALQVIEFAHGLISLLAVKADAQSPLVDHPVRDLKDHLPNIESRIVAVFRGNRAIIPDGDTRIAPGDEVFFVAATRHIRLVTKELRREENRVKRIMIAGGGNIGMRVARGVSDTMTPKIIEGSQARCAVLAQQLNGQALVLHGDSTDEELLAQENVGGMDLFLALTNDDENNIMSALLAKRMGARRVIALINRRAYAELMEGSQLDIAITPSHATIGELLKVVRRGDVAAVHSLRRGAAEALEIVAHGDRRTSRVVGRKVEEIGLPSGASIGALVRHMDSDEPEVLMAHHDTVIESSDHLIIFVIDKRMIPRVEKLFQVSAGFF
jgi:trk system potassium uptake protein TrkA